MLQPQLNVIPDILAIETFQYRARWLILVVTFSLKNLIILINKRFYFNALI